MLSQILKRLGAIIYYLLLLSLSRIWKQLSRKYYNAYSDINGKTVNKYAVTFTLIGLDEAAVHLLEVQFIE